MSTDLLGQCVTEAELDDPATWMNKAGKLPRPAASVDYALASDIVKAPAPSKCGRRFRAS